MVKTPISPIDVPHRAAGRTRTAGYNPGLLSVNPEANLDGRRRIASEQPLVGASISPKKSWANAEVHSFRTPSSPACRVRAHSKAPIAQPGAGVVAPLPPGESGRGEGVRESRNAQAEEMSSCKETSPASYVKSLPHPLPSPGLPEGEGRSRLHGSKGTACCGIAHDDLAVRGKLRQGLCTQVGDRFHERPFQIVDFEPIFLRGATNVPRRRVRPKTHH